MLNMLAWRWRVVDGRLDRILNSDIQVAGGSMVW